MSSLQRSDELPFVDFTGIADTWVDRLYRIDPTSTSGTARFLLVRCHRPQGMDGPIEWEPVLSIVAPVEAIEPTANCMLEFLARHLSRRMVEGVRRWVS